MLAQPLPVARPPAARARLVATAALERNAKALNPKQLVVERQIGEGSFGQVFLGTWRQPIGDSQRVVLKRVKARVEGAAEMGQMELVLNCYAAKVAKAHCAEFLGYCEVSSDEATSRLTQGLWLMWKYEGQRTLAYYLRRRDTLRALASDLEIAEEAVCATVMKQLFEGLSAFHGAGLVHRDLKPLNVIFAENSKRFKLIDLGACADLRTGTNYVPDESILDPNYCPPEQYVLPTDAPHLAKSMLSVAISPMLWAQYKPDRFDMWSAGVCMLQLCVPSMRQDRGLRNFNVMYGSRFNYDLDAWRASSFIPAREFEVLDAEDGAGWELVKALLRPRSIKTLPDNTVVFVNDKSLQRISAAEALRHKFLRQAREPGSIFVESGTASGSSSRQGSSLGSAGKRAGSSGQKRAGTGPASKGTAEGSAQRGSKAPGRTGSTPPVVLAASNVNSPDKTAQSFGAAVDIWRNLTNKLFDLEANIMVTASATEKQSTVVKKLQAKAAKGQAAPDALRKEQAKLNSMEQELTSLQDEFNTTANSVNSVLGMLGFGRSKPAQPKQVVGTGGKSAPAAGSTGSKGGRGAPAAPVAAAAAAQPSSTGSSSTNQFWSQVQSRLSLLQNRLENQAAATQRQQFTVKKLRAGVQTGAVEPATLQRAERILQRMEKRLESLDTDIQAARQETDGLLGMFGLGGNSSKGQQQAPAAVKAAVAAAPAASPAVSQPAEAKPKAGAFGGFFSRMFGGSSAAAKPAEAAQTQPVVTPASPQAQAKPVQPQQPAPEMAPAMSQSAPSPSRDNTPVISKDITDGASALIANSLKFTGLAAKVAFGMAASLKADAEKALRQMEEESEVKRQKKLAEQAFMRMLRSKEPPMAVGTTFAEVEQVFGGDPRFVAVEAAQRPLLVSAYVDALLQAELRAKAAAENKLRQRLRQVLSPESTWGDIQLQVAQEPVFQAVDLDTAQAIFEEVLAGVRDEEEVRAVAARAEVAFKQLLEDLGDPPIGRDSTWPSVKPQVWKDHRYLAVPESRRREIFAAVKAEAVQEAQAAAEQQRAIAAAEAQSVAEIVASTAPAPTPVDTSLIDQLRAEQERLRSEYAKMEEKLRLMERELSQKQQQGTVLKRRPGATPVPIPGAPAEVAAAVASARAATPSLRRQAPVTASAPNGNGNGNGNGSTAPKQQASSENGNGASRLQNILIRNKTTPTGARAATPVVARSNGAQAQQQQRGAPSEAQQAASGTAAEGVDFKRLSDGTLIFSFTDRNSKSPTPDPSSSRKEPVSSRAGSSGQ